MSQPGFVAIGRNEGDRLKRCLRSLVGVAPQVVYVDSGSTDGSVEFARSLGVEVVGLDTSKGFTMARARNAGWRRLVARWPEIDLVHFVDGDCELIDGWIGRALDALGGNPEAAVVCGRRRERHPGASVFNVLCEIEWNTPVGEAASCGGDAIIRREVLEKLQGYDESLIAGEEPELCLRIRQAGWKILRIDADMTLHDANITRWVQWWNRCVRGGYGAADVAQKTAGRPGGPLFAGQVRSASRWSLFVAFWAGALVPVSLVVGSLHGIPAGVGAGIFGFTVLALIMVLQMAKITAGIRQRAGGWGEAAVYGFWTLLAKLPQTIGILRHRADLKARKPARLIEYKQ